MSSETARPPRMYRTVVGAVLIADVIVTAGVLLAMPSGFYGSLAKGRVAAGVFVLFPVVVLLAIGVPMAIAGAVRDWRSAKSEASK
ncbi:MAG: hypothetical protein D9V44_09730 [Actinobacteria bacterium]|nr:MAG: hypothetical protein D9V44_09730 [Actinomycetota bacterium]